MQLYYERLTAAIISPPPEADDDLDEEDADADAEGDADADRDASAEARLDADGDTGMHSVSAGKAKGKAQGTRSPAATPQPTLASFAARGSGNAVRDAALASLRGDPGLHQLVPYLVQWVGEKVRGRVPGSELRSESPDRVLALWCC